MRLDAWRLGECLRRATPRRALPAPLGPMGVGIWVCLCLDLVV